jgi:uncharacterized protein
MVVLKILILLFLFSSCTSLFYHPDSFIYSRPELLNLDYENMWIKSTDGTPLHAWKLKAKKSNYKKKNLVILFHGNAQNVSAMYLHVAWLYKYGFDVITFDYQGYGKSPGKPSPNKTVEDAKAWINYAYLNKDKYNKIVMVGQSLGGIILTRALGEIGHMRFIDLLVLDSTFMSYQDAAFDRASSNWITYLLSPLSYLLFSDKKASEELIHRINIPTLVIHGKDDGVISFKLGEELFNSLKTKKWSWWIEGGRHTDVFWREDFAYRDKFIKLLEKI